MAAYKISIVTVSYNAKDTIGETIESVLCQKNENVEYVIIDGGSTDGTLEIIARYGDNIDKVISEPDNGISDAFNKGIKNSTGDIICIVNSDDVLYGGTIDIARSFFSADSELDILYGDARMFTDDVEQGYIFKADTDLTKLRYSFRLPHPGMFIARKAYDKFGMYDVALKNAMDYELVARMYMGGAKLQYADTIMAGFREGGTSSSALSRTLKELRAIAKNNGAGIFEREGYIAHIYLRRLTAPILKALGIENILHKIVKGY